MPLATMAARADEAASRALIDRAIAAHGGEARLAKIVAVTAKLKGTFHGLGAGVTFTGEMAAQTPDKLKIVIEADAQGQKIRLISVLNGDKGWSKFDDEVTELDKDELAEAQEEAYAEWVATLLPLKDKAFTMAALGEITVEGKPAFGVKVSRKDHRDVSLFFDKETALLVKTESRVHDELGMEVAEETFLGGYQDVEGTKQAIKYTIKRDGQLYLEGEAFDYRLLDKLDDEVFARP
jgi:hypothetical protein